MSKRKRKPTAKRQWETMYQTRETPTKATLQLREQYIADGLVTREQLDAMLRVDETWANDRYRVAVKYLTEDQLPGFDGVPHGTRDGWVHLSIHSRNRRPVADWRHFQQIKNDIMGPDREAVELYPDEKRLVDTANEYHLWVLPSGSWLPVGFTERMVSSAQPGGKGRQRPITVAYGEIAATPYAPVDEEE